MNNKLTIPFVEMMVTQVCNLSCPGCSTYSDIAHSGYVTWENGKKQLEPWLSRVSFKDFGVMGGEPLINPVIKDWLCGLRELMPNTQIRFPTNGILLTKHLEIVDLLHDIGNCILKITIHTEDKRINDAIKWIQNRYKWNPVTEFGIARWKTSNNMTFQINKPSTFNKTFKNDYNNAEPYSSNPVDAFKFCHQKLCPLLINGRIYKCSTSGLMDSVLNRYDYPNPTMWKDYLDDKLNGSIGIDSNDNDISEFIDNVGKWHHTCSQCPTNDTASVLDHQSTVIKRYL